MNFQTSSVWGWNCSRSDCMFFFCSTSFWGSAKTAHQFFDRIAVKRKQNPIWLLNNCIRIGIFHSFIIHTCYCFQFVVYWKNTNTEKAVYIRCNSITTNNSRSNKVDASCYAQHFSTVEWYSLLLMEAMSKNVNLLIYALVLNLLSHMCVWHAPMTRC